MEDCRKSSSFDDVKIELTDVNTIQKSQNLEEINNVTIKVEADWSDMENSGHFQWTKPESKNFVSDELTTSTGDGISRWTVMSTTLTPSVKTEESLQTVRIGLESEHPKDKPAICATNGGGLVDVFTGNHSGTYWSPKHEITSDEDGSPVDDFPSLMSDPPAKSLDCGTPREEMSELNRVTHLCDVCGKQYSSASALCKHRRSMHTTYTCTICGKAIFSTYKDLTGHRRTDTGEEASIKCGVCNKKFPHLGVLSIHQKIYHNIHLASIQNGKLCSDQASLAKQKQVDNVGHIQLTSNTPERKVFNSNKDIDDFPKISSKSAAEKDQPKCVALDVHVPFRAIGGKFQCSAHQPEIKTYNGDVLQNNTDDGIMRWTVTHSDILPLGKPEETSKTERVKCAYTTVAISNDSSTSPIQNPKFAFNKDGNIMNLSPCEASEPHIKAIVCVSDVTQQNVSNPDVTHYKCTICGKGFSGADLPWHQCEQTGEKLQRLGVCDKGFPESSNIRFNPHSGTGEQPDACNICGKRISISNTVRRYQVQNTDANGYNCDLCEKCFTPSCYVASQQCTQNVEKLFNCSFCNKEFTDQEALRQHCLTHKEKPYKCATCGRGFSHQMYLDRHMCTREKSRHKCTDCGKNFATGFSLRRHRRIHTGEKCYECEFCHKKFTDKSHLTEHRRTHTGEKPYKCDICQQEYARSQSLRKHLCIRGGK